MMINHFWRILTAVKYQRKLKPKNIVIVYWVWITHVHNLQLLASGVSPHEIEKMNMKKICNNHIIRNIIVYIIVIIWTFSILYMTVIFIHDIHWMGLDIMLIFFLNSRKA